MKDTRTLRLPPELLTTLSTISYKVFFALSIQLAIEPEQSKRRPSSRISYVFRLPFCLLFIFGFIILPFGLSTLLFFYIFLLSFLAF